jgi:hypothetical protein
MKPKRSLTFTHSRYLGSPLPGQKYSEAPHARMTVTAVRNGKVYYRFAEDEGPGQYWVRIEKFDEIVMKETEY